MSVRSRQTTTTTDMLTCLIFFFYSFLSQARRLAESDYIPTVDDVIRARLKTTGILETFFQLGKLNIQ